MVYGHLHVQSIHLWVESISTALISEFQPIVRTQLTLLFWIGSWAKQQTTSIWTRYHGLITNHAQESRLLLKLNDKYLTKFIQN